MGSEKTRQILQRTEHIKLHVWLYVLLPYPTQSSQLKARWKFYEKPQMIASYYTKLMCRL